MPSMTEQQRKGNVGRALRVARASRGVTQRALARRLRVSANYLSLIENGRRQPSLSLLQKAGRELGVAPALLLMDRPEVASRVTPEFSERVERVLRLLSELLEMSAPAPRSRHGRRARG